MMMSSGEEEETSGVQLYAPVPTVTREVEEAEERFAQELKACYDDLMESLVEWYQGEISDLGSIPSTGHSDYVAWNRRRDEIQGRYTMLHTMVEFRYGGKLEEEVVMGSGSNDADTRTKKPQLSMTDFLPLFIGGFTRHKADGSSLTRISIRAISAGEQHIIALSTGGVPYTWGNGDDGALGRQCTVDGNNRTPHPVTGFKNFMTGEIDDYRITQIAAGDNHSLFLSMSGAVYQCGTYNDGDSGKFRVVNLDTESPEGSNLMPVHISKMPRKAIMILHDRM